MSHPNSSDRSLTIGSNAFIILRKNSDINRKQNQIQDKSPYYVVFIAVILLGVLVTYSFADFSVSAARGGIPGKALDVQKNSNGFPSGPHLNLNIHGRGPADWNGCESVTPHVGDPLGGNINAPVDGAGNITLVVNNKKTSLTNMTVWDNCTENVHPDDDDPALIQLPTNDDGWYVYVRILGKPNNNNGEASSVVLTPDPSVLTMCNDNSTAPITGFENFTSCDQGAVGMMPILQISDGNIFNTTGVLIEKFDTIGKGKGRTQAVDMTDQFLWNGTVCNENLDTNFSDSITLADFDVTNSTGGDPDGVVNATDIDLLLFVGNLTKIGAGTDLDTGAEIVAAVDAEGLGAVAGEIEEAEFLFFLDLINECKVFDEPIWVFNTAELVIYGLDWDGEGATNVQIRFYDAGSVNVIRT